MNQKQRLIAALELREPDMIPTFEVSIDRKINFSLTGTEDPFDLVEKLGLDGVVVKPDYEKRSISKNTYVDEWGAKRQITSEFIADVIESPIKDITDAKHYVFPKPDSRHRFKTLEKAVERFGDTRAIILNLRDVFSDLRDLIGYEELLVCLITRINEVKELLEKTTAFNRELARVAHETFGIDILITTDDICYPKGLLFSPKVYWEVFATKFEQVIKSFKEIGYYCIKHCDGDITQVIDHWIHSGIDCIHPLDPSAKMDLGAFKKKYGDQICLAGSVDCMGALTSGSLEEVENDVKECIKKAAKGGGFILTSSNTIHSGVRPENYEKMVETVRQYGKYPIDFEKL